MKPDRRVTFRDWNHRLSVIGALIILIAAAVFETHCSSTAVPSVDAGGAGGMAGDRVGGTGGDSCPASTRPGCVHASAGPNGAVLCDDVSSPGTCVNGTWACMDGISTSSCTCYRPQPAGCSCTHTGWSCPADAGIRDATTNVVDAGIFACGSSSLYCGVGLTYCYGAAYLPAGTGGAGGSSPSDPIYACLTFPSQCEAPASCDCLCQTVCPAPRNQCRCTGTTQMKVDCVSPL
jgi:hypothetical protein